MEDEGAFIPSSHPECGSAWGIPRALDRRALEGLLGCSSRAQHGLRLPLPFRSCSFLGLAGTEEGAAGGSGEVCCLRALCFQANVLHFHSSSLENITSLL